MTPPQSDYDKRTQEKIDLEAAEKYWLACPLTSTPHWADELRGAFLAGIAHARATPHAEGVLAAELGPANAAALCEALNNAKAEITELRGLLGEAVDTINGVQNLIGSFTTNSSEILASVRDAWNVNARFLGKNFELQNEYLAKLRAAGEGKGGEDGK